MKHIFPVLFLLIFLSSCNTYIGRYLGYFLPGQGDVDVLPSKEIKNSPEAFIFPATERPYFSEINVFFNDKNYKGTLENLLESYSTNAFILIRNDTILYEKYFNGNTRKTIHHSFSLTKSVFATLMGIAIDKGYINSAEDKIIEYIPELDSSIYGEIEIKNLLNMNSGIVTSRIFLPWSDVSKAYYSPDVRKVALGSSDLKMGVEEKFFYSGHNTFLAAIILERASKMSVSEFAEKFLWTKIGTEFPATWTIDSKEHGFEKVESGLNATAIDYAKLGRLYLNKGVFDNNQIVSEDWVRLSTTANTDFVSKPGYFYPEMIENNICYQYCWRTKYTYSSAISTKAFFAEGINGHYLWVNPKENVIIVRIGNIYAPRKQNWIDLFEELTEMIK